MNRNEVPSDTQGGRTRRSGTRTATTMLSGFVIAGMFGVGAVSYFANQTVLASHAAPTTAVSSVAPTTTSLSGTAFRSTVHVAQYRGDDSQASQSSDR